MARLHAHLQSQTFRSPDWGAFFLTAFQFGTMSVFALFIVLAIVNTVLGTPQAEAPPPPST